MVGAIIVSRATSMGMAIAGEILVGIGYGVQPLLYAVASEILPRKYRPAAQAGLNFSTGVGGLVGLLGGSKLVANSPEGWRHFWYLITAMLAVCVVLYAVCYNPPSTDLQSTLTSSEKIRRVCIHTHHF